MTSHTNASVRSRIILFTLSKTILNTGFRMVYPFLPTFARGLNVELSTLALAVSVRSWLGVVSPILGSLADIRSRKSAMLLGMGIFFGGFGIITLSPTISGLFIALIFSGLAKTVFDPAVQAYLGDTIAYDQRGSVIAISELGWSFSFLIGIPVIGLLIANWGWHAPFPVLTLIGLLFLITLFRIIPGEPNPGSTTSSLRINFKQFFSHPRAMSVVFLGFLISAGNETVAIIYGAWMEQAFEIKVAVLGIASAIIGFAELGGEGSVAILVDRLGKRTSVGIGIFINTLAAAALPFLGQSLAGALFGLFLFYLSYEFTLVSSIPLMSEMLPEARATSISFLIAGTALGRAIGALTGPALFDFGILANCIIVGLFDIIALVVLITFVRE